MTSEKIKSGGIIVHRGTSLRISNIHICLDPTGTPRIPPVTVELSLRITPYWLEIAMSHLEDAEKHHNALLGFVRSEESPERGKELEGEFKASMQAIVAAATALDAFYASVKDHVQISEDQIKTWRTNRTERYKQITEVLRRGFSLKKETTGNLRKILKEINRYRGWAVHPLSAFSAPKLHPDLGNAVEWRFVAFRFHNAREIVRAALAFATLLTLNVPDQATDEFKKMCSTIAIEIEKLCVQWRSQYGRLTDDDELENTMKSKDRPPEEAAS